MSTTKSKECPRCGNRALRSNDYSAPAWECTGCGLAWKVGARQIKPKPPEPPSKPPITTSLDW